MKRPTVILERCEEYDSERIYQLALAALTRLDLRPHGRTLVKPNCVMSGPSFPHAFTRPEFLSGVLRALKERAVDDIEEIALGERCGITIPTRHAFKEAGYYPMLKEQGVKPYHFDEVTQVEIPLYHQHRLRDAMFFPEPIAKADFFVNCPKFKAHPWTTVTFSLKNYIGIQDDRHRLIDHDHRLDEKIADLQYAIQPQFIAIDAITAGEGRMLTPMPFDMGMMIMGDNQVAFDAVCCHIIGIDPRTVPHIMLAFQRGFGPIDLDQIDIVGGISLEAAKAKAEGFSVGLIRVEDYFKGTPITAYAGPPPEGQTDYCWGGCPGAMEEAIELLRVFVPDADERMSDTRIHVVFGAYDGPIEAAPGETVVFIGDCAQWKGTIHGDQVSIESVYEDRSTKDPRQATHDDIFAKMAKVMVKTAGKRGGVVRVAGCPVSVAEQLLTLVSVGKLPNPYFDPSQAIPFTSAYLSWRTRNLMHRVLGEPYQKAGPTERGAARPAQNLPPEGAPTPLEQAK